MMLSAIDVKRKARNTTFGGSTHANALNTAAAEVSAPRSGKKQRSLHDFFPQKPMKTERKKKRPAPSGTRLSFMDDEPVKKRIDYDTSSSDVRDDDSSDVNSASQNSDASFSMPQPKRIDFSMCSSQHSEPDVEPADAPAKPPSAPPIKIPPTENPLFLRSSSHSSFVDAPSFSASSFSRMFSQDEFDFLTPQDQPVMHLSHPTTPSPMKKRHRRNHSTEVIQEEEVQNLTQDMVQMDVCTRAAPPLPPSAEKAKQSPLGAQTPVRSESDISVQLFNKAKRRSRLSTGSIPGAPPLPSFESHENPFAPTPQMTSKKRRSRQMFPPSFGNEKNAQGYSRYLTEFVEQELLGSGSFSKVFKCLKRIDGWTYAVKKSKRHFRGKADTERALREVHALAALSHSRHVVRYFDAWIEDDLLYIQLEHCSGCSLPSFVEKYKPHHVPEEALCKMLCHIAQALRDMHSRKIVHMDVKLQNILVAPGDIYKLGDLGTVAHMDGHTEITEGDNRYLSRELLEGSRSNLRAGDIFALGATIYELALGETLPSNGEDWQSIRDGDLVMFRQYSNSLQHLLASMMHPDLLQRPSAEEILQHEVVLPFL